jgi:hypothetical protein
LGRGKTISRKAAKRKKRKKDKRIKIIFVFLNLKTFAYFAALREIRLKNLGALCGFA